MTHCTRCGKTGLQPDSIHTCSLPTALALAHMLESDNIDANEYADDLNRELRRLHQSEREGWRYADELEQQRKNDEALLRQALEALDWIVTGRGHDTIETAHAALKERLGKEK